MMTMIQNLIEMQIFIAYKFQNIDFLMFALIVANANDKIYDDNKNMTQLKKIFIEFLFVENVFMIEYSKNENCVIFSMFLQINICKSM